MSVGEPEIAATIEELGHSVVRLPERQSTIADVERAIDVDGCDMVLYSKFRLKDTPRARQAFIERCGVPCVAWCFDLYYGL